MTWRVSKIGMEIVDISRMMSITKVFRWYQCPVSGKMFTNTYGDLRGTYAGFPRDLRVNFQINHSMGKNWETLET